MQRHLLALRALRQREGAVVAVAAAAGALDATELLLTSPDAADKPPVFVIDDLLLDTDSWLHWREGLSPTTVKTHLLHLRCRGDVSAAMATQQGRPAEAAVAAWHQYETLQVRCRFTGVRILFFAFCLFCFVAIVNMFSSATLTHAHTFFYAYRCLCWLRCTAIRRRASGNHILSIITLTLNHVFFSYPSCAYSFLTHIGACVSCVASRVADARAAIARRRCRRARSKSTLACGATGRRRCCQRGSVTGNTSKCGCVFVYLCVCLCVFVCVW
jgi:hypothetical protein